MGVMDGEAKGVPSRLLLKVSDAGAMLGIGRSTVYERSTITRGGWVDPQRSARPLDEVAAAWLRSNPGKRPATIARDEVELRLHILPPLARRTIGSVTPTDIEELVRAWSATAEPRTVGRRYGVLRAVMNYAVSRDLIGRSPCRGIKLPQEQPLDRELPTASEVAALAEAMGRYGPMAYLGVVLGMRWGEVAGLRVGRVDLEAGRITIAEQITRGPRGISVVGPPKSHAGRRVLSMPSLLTEMLTEHPPASAIRPPSSSRRQTAAISSTRTGASGSGCRRAKRSVERSWASMTFGEPTPRASWPRVSTSARRRSASATPTRASPSPSTPRPRPRPIVVPPTGSVTASWRLQRGNVAVAREIRGNIRRGPVRSNRT